MSKDNSGPAFPGTSISMGYGMTKRELIAMHMQASIIGNSDLSRQITKAVGSDDELFFPLVAALAKNHADALLAELAKE